MSGGCVEDDLLEKLRLGQLATDKPALLIYGATDDDQIRFNLPCGGQLHIIIEPLTDTRHLADINPLVVRLQQRALAPPHILRWRPRR